MLVFCSYTLRDGLVTIEKLRKLKELISKSADCYIDILDNDSIDKQERVVEELSKAQLVLVLMSPDLKNSAWVKEEYRIAHEKKIPLVEININHMLFFLTFNTILKFSQTIDSVVQICNCRFRSLLVSIKLIL